MSHAGNDYPWGPDQGGGIYQNPLLFADYSDPDVVRVHEDFYLTSSSFNCVPGLPILHSLDLVNWTLINHALKELPHPRYAEVQPVRREDDWLLVGESHDDHGVGCPVSRHPKPAAGKKPEVAIPQSSDEFTGDQPGLQWQWHPNPEESWHSLAERPGNLR